ncbi:transcriptional regulator [Candidatus Pacearchaeota archaeon]|nr:transcriptional regulator [Candidatus Pacearchaeota archaeon]
MLTIVYLIKMYSLPQEIEVWYIIPAIRKELSKLLTGKYKMTFDKAGSLLGISKAAVSQYLKNKRANKIKLPKEIKKEIEKSAEIIVKDEKLALREIIRILTLTKKMKCSCEICKKYNHGILNQCKMMPVDGE